ncbi:MAG: hypothetical protein ACYCX4_10255 [Bacillota bacterium]
MKNDALTVKAGSERCNTDPAKCIELGNGIKVVNFCVDSLYISFNGKLKEGVLIYLEDAKEVAQKDGGPIIGYEYPGGRLVIQPYGTKGYPYLLDGEDFSIKIGEGKVGPTIFAELRAHFLYTYDFVNAYQLVMNVIKEFIEEGEFCVSRIDLCVDLIGWRPEESIYNKIVTRAKKRGCFHEGRKLTGFTFGAGRLSCRIYNKTIEINRSGKKWMEAVWRKMGWQNTLNPVWRVEFQLRREILGQFGVKDPEDVFAALNSIWEYCTKDWFCLRIPTDSDGTKSRWPMEPWWAELANMRISETGVEVVREIYREIQMDKVVDGLIAYESSLAAAKGVFNFDSAIMLAKFISAQRLDKRNKKFEEIVEEKRKRKGLPNK